jgi:hypothetical protein
MPVILVNRVVDKKRIIGKGRAEEEERHKGLLTSKNPNQIKAPFNNRSLIVGTVMYVAAWLQIYRVSVVKISQKLGKSS